VAATAHAISFLCAMSIDSPNDAVRETPRVRRTVGDSIRRERRHHRGQVLRPVDCWMTVLRQSDDERVTAGETPSSNQWRLSARPAGQDESVFDLCAARYRRYSIVLPLRCLWTISRVANELRSGYTRTARNPSAKETLGQPCT
jgi:hypothetical protein